MCGIIGGFNIGTKDKEPVNEWVIDQFQDQKNRGTSGFGVVFIEQDGTHKITRATELVKCMMDSYKNEAPMILMHHRIPTSSANKILQTHPMVVDNGSLKYKYLVIHNGIIRNASELKTKHEEELGFTYNTIQKQGEYSTEFNDSESLAIELARFVEGQVEKVEAIGSAAFIGAQINKKNNKIVNIFFGRNNGNPLHMSKTRDKIRLSSEGEGDDITEDILYSFNLKDFKLKKKKLEIKTSEGFFSRFNTNRTEREDTKSTFSSDHSGRGSSWVWNSEKHEYIQKDADEIEIPKGYTEIMDKAQEEIKEKFEEMQFTELIDKIEEEIKEEENVFGLDPATIIRMFAIRIKKIIDFAQTRMSMAIADQEEFLEKTATKNKEAETEPETSQTDISLKTYPNEPHHPDCDCITCETKEGVPFQHREGGFLI